MGLRGRQEACFRPSDRQREKSKPFHGLAHSKFIWGFPSLVLTTKGSYLSWGRVAKPLVSLLIPVPQYTHIHTHTHKQTDKYKQTQKKRESDTGEEREKGVVISYCN